MNSSIGTVLLVFSGVKSILITRHLGVPLSVFYANFFFYQPVLQHLFSAENPIPIHYYEHEARER